MDQISFFEFLNVLNWLVTFETRKFLLLLLNILYWLRIPRSPGIAGISRNLAKNF
jgi:hypothetical protein